MFKNWLIALKDQISLHFLDTWSNFLSISWQNVFPGISPAKRIKFLLPGNFLASGSYGHYIKPMTHVYTRERHENKNTRFWATYGTV